MIRWDDRGRLTHNPRFCQVSMLRNILLEWSQDNPAGSASKLAGSTVGKRAWGESRSWKVKGSERKRFSSGSRHIAVCFRQSDEHCLSWKLLISSRVGRKPVKRTQTEDTITLTSSGSGASRFGKILDSLNIDQTFRSTLYKALPDFHSYEHGKGGLCKSCWVLQRTFMTLWHRETESFIIQAIIWNSPACIVGNSHLLLGLIAHLILVPNTRVLDIQTL